MSASPHQSERAAAFSRLHEASTPFVMPNPWDAGSARLLADTGFAALATTSAGAAFAIGYRDTMVTRDEALGNAAAIVAATDLPVSADLEDGYADTAAGVAETIQLAADAGLVGGSIEDSAPSDPTAIRSLSESVARVAAAVAAKNALPFRFTLTARAENFLRGNNDLADTIDRLRAYAEAGADVLFAPGLPDLAAVTAVCQSVDRPVSVMAGLPGQGWTVAELAACGVQRVSVGPALSLAAFGAAERAAREIIDTGTFAFADQATDFARLSAIMSDQRRPTPPMK